MRWALLLLIAGAAHAAVTSDPNLTIPIISDGGGSGTVTSITAGNGLTGGTITGSGTIALSAPVIPANGGLGSTGVPAAGQIPVGNAGGTAYAPVSLSGDVTNDSTGAVTIANNAITTAKIAASAVDLTTKVTGVLPGTNGGLGVNNGANQLTVPATGTAALLGVNNAFAGANTFGTSVIPVTIAPGAATGVSPPTHFQYTDPADTNLSNGVVGLPPVLFDLSSTKQWGGNTAVANYKAIDIKAPVLSSTTATTAFGTASTVCIEGPPTAGANATASGAIALLINSGNMTLNAGTMTLKGAPSNAVITQSAASSGAAQSFLLTGGAHTNQTAGANLTQFALNFGQTEQHATGAVALNQTILFTGPTLSAVGTSTTTTADTLAISAPVAGTNMTLTTANSLHLTSGNFQNDGTSTLGTIGSTFVGNVNAGVQSGRAANAGEVGEVLTVNTSTYTNYTTTATLQQVATLSITPGAWDITAYGTFSGAGATLTSTGNSVWGLSTTTASTTGTTEGLGDLGYISEAGVNVTSGKSSIVLHKVINISTTTSYFLNSSAVFTGGNPQFVGSIVAHRIR